ncbi:Pre-mRNA-splicing factor cwc22 [Verticillium dahliae VDG1]|nr:Pre-mRNA-splicing factor cwc22 [Verticillium dahliae VDG1]
MVSFFGLKLGGDKKKKNDKSANFEGPQPKDGDSDFFGTSLNKQDLLRLDASTPIPRPGTASSNRFHATQQSSIGSGVRHYGSDTNLRTRWNNASSTRLVPPPMTPAAANGRPGTAASNRGTGWVNPLDVHFCRDGSSGSTPSRTQQQQRPSTSSGAKASTPTVTSTAPQIPRSPLGQFEFNLAPLDVSSPTTLQPVNPLRRAETNPMQLQPASAADEDRALKLTKSHSPPRSYPSPPPSLNSTEKPGTPVTTPAIEEGTSYRHRDPAQPEKCAAAPQNIDSLPSPASSHEDQEMSSWDRPVIRDVTAKRDTLTYHPTRRQSVSMDIEELSRIDFGFDFGLDKKEPSPAVNPSPVMDADRSYGLSPANRRAAPPRLHVPAPPLRDEGSPLSPSYQFPRFDEGDTFSAPRQAPSPLGASPRLQQESPRESPPSASSWPLTDGGGADVSKPHAPLVSPSFWERSPPPQWAEDRRKVERAKTPPLEGDAGMGTRPDFGLRAPTGIADEFQVGFI